MDSEKREATKILVIDDDLAFRQMLAKLLQRAGYATVSAHNGKVGLQLCQEAQPDLVITDIVMPEQDGIETIGLLRRRFPHVKIVAISGGGQRIGAAVPLTVAAKLGAHALFEKPIPGQELLDVVEGLLE